MTRTDAMNSERSRSGHRPIDHTGDVAIELWAPTEEELLAEGARAAAEIMTGDGGGEAARSGGEVRTVRLDTLDREDRLVQWLNEVIYLAVSEGLIVRDADIEIPDGAKPGCLVARVRGASLEPGALATELKSATYHGLRVERDAAGSWRARVVIDV